MSGTLGRSSRKYHLQLLTNRTSAHPEAVADLLLAAVLGVLVASQLGAPYDATAVEAELHAMLAPPPARPVRRRSRRIRDT